MLTPLRLTATWPKPFLREIPRKSSAWPRHHPRMADRHPARCPRLRQQQSGNIEVNMDFLQLRRGSLEMFRAKPQRKDPVAPKPWRRRNTPARALARECAFRMSSLARETGRMRVFFKKLSPAPRA